MIAELRHAVANYAHALDELNVPALEAIPTQSKNGFVGAPSASSPSTLATPAKQIYICDGDSCSSSE